MKLKDDIEKYPYFVYPLLEALRECKDESEAAKLRERIAVNVGDEDALRRLLAEGYVSFKEFYPDMRPVHGSTDDTIDAFIEKFGGKTAKQDTPLLPEVEAPSDYFASIEPTSDPFASDDEDEEESDGGDSEFKEGTDSGNLTLELARIMIKKGNYNKAIEIIRDIYLNNPEKSIYFADQIRFIKKMMLNDSKKN